MQNFLHSPHPALAKKMGLGWTLKKLPMESNNFVNNSIKVKSECRLPHLNNYPTNLQDGTSDNMIS